LVGLKNHRNTCFANVIIQAISRLSGIREFVGRCDLLSAKETLFCYVMSIVNDIWAGQDKVLSPWPLLQAVSAKYGHQFGQEEDAHWFLELLLEDLRSEVAEIYPRRVDQLRDLIRVATLPLGDGDNNSESAETTLEKCLARWRQGDDVLWSPRQRHAPLGGDSGASTRDKRVSGRAADVLPQVYAFHFDRARWTGRIISRATRSGAKAKDTTRVQFPDSLTGEAITGNVRDARFLYKLVAMVVHHGLTPATGHYYVYLTQPGEHGETLWFKFDDASRPTQVSLESVQADEPSLLFFQQVV
jgi:ubiquitin C-terminal hydrolase